MAQPGQPSALRQKFGIQKRTSSLRLSTRTLNVYREAFSAIDKKGEGSITKDQLKTVLGKLGQKPTDEELDSMMNLDPNSNGRLQFSTFAKLMSTRMPEDQQNEELKEVFDVFDKGSDGTVSLSEIKAILSEVYEESFDDLQELIGIRGDRIDFATFKKLMNGEKF